MLRRTDQALKRALDLSVSALLLLVSSPLWPAIVLLIWLESPGPVIFAGRRVGRGGHEFRMYKFRSMRAGSNAPGQPGITTSGDPRVTRVGRILRSTKLDELPQLLNVLRGEMSLVGPRPEAREYVDLSNDTQRRVLSVRPGITGPAALVYRHEERMIQYGENADTYYRTVVLPHKLQLDLEYVIARTFWRDIQLLLQTLARLFTHAQ